MYRPHITRNAFVAIATLLLFLITPIANAATIVNVADYNAEVTGNANVRSSTSSASSGNIIGQRYRGSTVRVLRHIGIWREIQWGTRVAYIYGTLLRKIPTASSQQCSSSDLLPAHQLYSNARADMNKENGRRFRIQKDPAQGVVVINAWIRGKQRQALYTSSNILNPVRAIETDPDSDRGATANFKPGDSRATIVLDYHKGKGWIVMTGTTFRVNLRAAPDIKIKRKAYKPKFDYATRDPSWIWEDTPIEGIRRVRVHVTAKPPTGGVWDTLQAWLTPSVDFQVFLSRNGSASYQGDTFPNVAVFRYLNCNKVPVRKIYEQHERDRFAWLNMAARPDWGFDKKYTRFR